jgi:hypothetical protein
VNSGSISSVEWSEPGSSESSLFLSGSIPASSSDEPPLRLVDIDEDNKGQIDTQQELVLPNYLLVKTPAISVLAQPYSIPSLKTATEDAKCKKKEYALISSLIRKVGSYDAQIIAEKTHHQLLRTALSQERLTYPINSQRWEMSFAGRELSSPADNTFFSAGHGSPAGKSLFSASSSSSSSSGSDYTGRTKNACVPVKRDSSHDFELSGEPDSVSSQCESELAMLDDNTDDVTTILQRRKPTETPIKMTGISVGGSYSCSDSPSSSQGESKLVVIGDNGKNKGGVVLQQRVLIPPSTPETSSVLHETVQDPNAPARLNNTGSENCIKEELSADPAQQHKESSENNQAGNQKANLRVGNPSNLKSGRSSSRHVEIYFSPNEIDIELGPSSSVERNSDSRSRESSLEQSQSSWDDEAAEDNDEEEALEFDEDEYLQKLNDAVEAQQVAGKDRVGEAEDEEEVYQSGAEESVQESGSETPSLALSCVSGESDVERAEDSSVILPDQHVPPFIEPEGYNTDPRGLVHGRQISLFNRLLSGMSGLVRRGTRSESTLLEPLMPRTSTPLDEAALWQIRFNLEPPVDPQFHDDLLYILEEGHLLSGSTGMMMPQGPPASFCTRVVRKCCRFGRSLLYLLAVVFYVSVVTSSGAGLGLASG